MRTIHKRNVTLGTESERRANPNSTLEPLFTNPKPIQDLPHS